MLPSHIARAVCVLMLAGCTFGSPSTFSVGNASVDPSHTCPVGASNAQYDVHGTIDASNGTSKAVTISIVDATLTLAAVNGGWLQKVGDRYSAPNLSFTPDTVGAGSTATLAVTIPIACTGRVASSPVASGDYAVSFSLATSAGTFKLDSKNRHRIITG